MHAAALDLSARPSLGYRYNRSAHMAIARDEIQRTDPPLERTDDENAYRHQNVVRMELVKRGLVKPARRRPKAA